MQHNNVITLYQSKDAYCLNPMILFQYVQGQVIQVCVLGKVTHFRVSSIHFAIRDTR